MYAKSGARWEPAKKEYNKQSLRAIHEDSILRGDVATVFCGDANLTVEDAPDVFDSFRKSRWVDSAWYGIGGFDDRPTSLQGNGARIDLAFVNHTASSPVFHYQLVEGVNKDDRRMLDTSLRVPLACQYWYMSKRIGARDDHVNPPHDYVPPHIATDERIRRCLLEKKIDEAYKRWVKNAEGWFNKIPLVKGGCGSGVGKTSLRRLTVYPPEGTAGADVDKWQRP